MIAAIYARKSNERVAVLRSSCFATSGSNGEDGWSAHRPPPTPRSLQFLDRHLSLVRTGARPRIRHTPVPPSTVAGTRPRGGIPRVGTPRYRLAWVSRSQPDPHGFPSPT